MDDVGGEGGDWPVTLLLRERGGKGEGEMEGDRDLLLSGAPVFLSGTIGFLFPFLF